MAFPKKVKHQAFLAYKEFGTIDGAVSITGISRPTIEKWKDEYNWDARIENYKEKIAEDPYGEDRNIENFCNDILDEPNRSDVEVLKQVKVIEGICFSMIKYGEEETAKKAHLYPKSFETAVKSLDICWRARHSILLRNKPDPKSITVNTQRIDLIGSLTQNYNEKEEE